MGCHANIGVWYAGDNFLTALEKLGIVIDVQNETPLYFLWRLTAKSRMPIENREERKANSCCVGCLRNARCHLRNIIVAAAIRRVVEIMELSHPREPGL